MAFGHKKKYSRKKYHNVYQKKILLGRENFPGVRIGKELTAVYVKLFKITDTLMRTSTWSFTYAQVNYKSQ